MCMPGERLGGPDSPVIRLILATEEFGKRFPGFEREVHGIEVDEQGNYWMRAVVETPEQKHAGNGNSKVHPPNSAPPIKKPRRPAVRRTPE
jgi:arginine decarboxylase